MNLVTVYINGKPVDAKTKVKPFAGDNHYIAEFVLKDPVSLTKKDRVSVAVFIGKEEDDTPLPPLPVKRKRGRPKKNA